jgi:hypothetical protein
LGPKPNFFSSYMAQIWRKIFGLLDNTYRNNQDTLLGRRSGIGMSTLS